MHAPIIPVHTASPVPGLIHGELHPFHAAFAPSHSLEASVLTKVGPAPRE